MSMLVSLAARCAGFEFRSSGELKIAEVASRFTDVEEFSQLVSSIGFKLKSKVDNLYLSMARH